MFLNPPCRRSQRGQEESKALMAWIAIYLYAACGPSGFSSTLPARCGGRSRQILSHLGDKPGQFLECRGNECDDTLGARTARLYKNQGLRSSPQIETQDFLAGSENPVRKRGGVPASSSPSPQGLVSHLGPKSRPNPGPGLSSQHPGLGSHAFPHTTRGRPPRPPPAATPAPRFRIVPTPVTPRGLPPSGPAGILAAGPALRGPAPPWPRPGTCVRVLRAPFGVDLATPGLHVPGPRG